MFPSAQDRAAHKGAVTRQQKEATERNRHASEIRDPDDLVNFILEVTAKKYRQGNKVIKFSVDVPIDNFAEWAKSVKISSQDMDQLDRIATRQEVARIARHKLKAKMEHGVYVRLEGAAASSHRFIFNVKVSVISRA